MNNTMIQFKETIDKINTLRNQEKLLIEEFKKSTGELSNCFHWILNSALDERNYCCLSTSTCSELYVEQLENIGFDIEEMRNDVNFLCGYRVKWK